MSSSLESAAGGGEDEAGGDGEESKKQRKPNAKKQASMIVIGLVRRMVRATAILPGSTVLENEVCRQRGVKSESVLVSSYVVNRRIGGDGLAAEISLIEGKIDQVREPERHLQLADKRADVPGQAEGEGSRGVFEMEILERELAADDRLKMMDAELSATGSPPVYIWTPDCSVRRGLDMSEGNWISAETLLLLGPEGNNNPI